VAGFNRNQWQLSAGISGNLRLESVAGFDRNQWQPSRGIRILAMDSDIWGAYDLFYVLVHLYSSA